MSCIVTFARRLGGTNPTADLGRNPCLSSGCGAAAAIAAQPALKKKPCEDAPRTARNPNRRRQFSANLAVLPGLQQLVVGNRLALGLLVGQLGPRCALVGEPLRRVALRVEFGWALG